MPPSALARRDLPEPTSPATPSTSPARSSKLTGSASGRSSSSRASRTTRSRGGFRAGRAPMSRPTIRRISSSVVSPSTSRLARLALHPLPLQYAGREALLAAEEHVLEHGQCRDEARLLVDGADAVMARLLRRQRPHLLTRDENVAGVGSLRAGHDLHERRF